MTIYFNCTKHRDVVVTFYLQRRPTNSKVLNKLSVETEKSQNSYFVHPSGNDI